MDFGHTDYLKKNRERLLRAQAKPRGGRGGRTGLAKPNCVPL